MTIPNLKQRPSSIANSNKRSMHHSPVGCRLSEPHFGIKMTILWSKHPHLQTHPNNPLFHHFSMVKKKYSKKVFHHFCDDKKKVEEKKKTSSDSPYQAQPLIFRTTQPAFTSMATRHARPAPPGPPYFCSRKLRSSAAVPPSHVGNPLSHKPTMTGGWFFITPPKSW